MNISLRLALAIMVKVCVNKMFNGGSKIWLRVDIFVFSLPDGLLLAFPYMSMLFNCNFHMEALNFPIGVSF